MVWCASVCVYVIFSGKRFVRCVIEAGIQKHGQGAKGGDDNKEPEEEAVHHDGNVLPVISNLQAHIHIQLGITYRGDSMYRGVCLSNY